jgi:hypothetical protein
VPHVSPRLVEVFSRASPKRTILNRSSIIFELDAVLLFIAFLELIVSPTVLQSRALIDVQLERIFVFRTTSFTLRRFNWGKPFNRRSHLNLLLTDKFCWVGSSIQLVLHETDILSCFLWRESTVALDLSPLLKELAVEHSLLPFFIFEFGASGG